METIDEEITARAIAWIEEQVKADQPFFLWYNSTAMHFRTHVAEKNIGKSGQDPYSDRMVVHDEQIGEILDKLDELGIADNTHRHVLDRQRSRERYLAGRRKHALPRTEGLQLGRRLASSLSFLRWPGKIKAGSVLNGIVSHIDMLPTLLAVAGLTRTSPRAPRPATRLVVSHLQGAPRRPQHAPVRDRQGEGEPQERRWSTSAMTATSSRWESATISSTCRCSARIRWSSGPRHS